MLSKEQALSLFRERRDRTAVIRLPREGGLYRRQEVISAITDVVNRGSFMSVGQLENNLRWEVVFSRHEEKNKLLASNLSVKGFAATVENLHLVQRRLRLTRIPMCVPHEYVINLLAQRKIQVKHMSYQIDKSDGLQSNTRIATVETDSWDNVPDVLPWSLDGLRGTALVFLQGRPPRCHRCGERGHKFFQCPYPYCTRCRKVGHTADEDCGPQTYAERMTGDLRASADDDLELQGEEQDEEHLESAARGDNPENREPTTAPIDQPSSATTDALTVTANDERQTDTTKDMAAADSSDGGGDGDEESVSEANDEGFRQPRDQRRRRRRTNKRAAASGGSASGDEHSKKRRESDVESDVESKSVDRASSRRQSPRLDPASGRRHSRSRLPTSRRQQ